MSHAAEIRALYALPCRAAGDAVAARSTDPHHRQRPARGAAEAHDGFRVHRPTGSEYPSAEPTYSVAVTETSSWAAPGLPLVAELRVRVRVDGVGQLVEALKDLYDPMVDVEIGTQGLGERFGIEDGARFGARALVVSLEGGAVSDVDDAALAQLMCKDTALAFDLDRMDVERPNDLNAARDNAIYVWGEQTVVRAMDAELRTRGWMESIVSMSALVTAAREATAAAAEDVRRLRSEERRPPLERLEAIVQAQARHDRSVSSRLDALAVSVGRPLASYLESLVRQTHLDAAIASLQGTLRDALRNIEVEARLDERRRAEQAAEAAREVRTVVSVFAVVSILLSVLGMAIGVASVPRPHESRYGGIVDVLAFSLLSFIAAGAVALALIRSTVRSSMATAAARRRAGVGASSVGLLLAGAMIDPEPGRAGLLLVGAVAVLLAAALAVARTYRLDGG